MPFLEARYTRMAGRVETSDAEVSGNGEVHDGSADVALARLARFGDGASAAETGQSSPLGATSRLQPGRGAEVLADVRSTYWQDVIEQYRQRQLAVRRTGPARLAGVAAFGRAVPPMPGIPGISNWVPCGPSVVRRGQPSGRPAISGRASGIAVAPGGRRLYLATPDGGVWRSDDGGDTWASTMENFDVDPTTFATISLSCGAIAIDEAQPDRVYVGTGEGDTDALFSVRVTSALPSYRGVGPLRSDDGGGTWVTESTDPASPPLAGEAFFQLAVDPADRERVVAATTAGLYRREPDGAGGFRWVRKRSGVHPSVVVARSGGTTTFFAAAWGDKVYSSSDGATWTAVGTGFPTSINRIGLAVRRTSASVVYALVANSSNSLQGVYRLDGGAGAWKAVNGAPAGLLGTQGDYDLTIAVDPNNANRIFLGGSAVNVSDGAIYRGVVSSTGGGTYSMTSTFVGAGSHPDVHALVYSPGDSDTVWSCCDGGLFRTATATGAATFEARNTGLSTMSANFLALHPTEPAVMFCGFQDNGTGRYTGEECWTHVWGGDGGYPVINWADPRRVLVFANGRVQRATDGGQDYPSFTDVTPTGAGWFVMAQPLVEAPPSTTASDAELIAYGAGPSIFLSSDFAASPSTWSTLPAVSGGSAFCITFATRDRFFVGTTGGRVFRYDRSGGTWTANRIDDAAGGALPIVTLVTDIAVDPADTTGASIFVALGGNGDYRHVWHFDGSSWAARSGPSAGALTSLLDVEHNALVVDGPTVYVGADIGVWRSGDAGVTWTPLENGLPDSAVLDLKLHAPSRRLVAALHGRGVFELKLDPPAPPDVELYLRDTTLDLGFVPTADGRDDPAVWPADVTRHWASPNIKVDVPTSAGWQTAGTDLDFYVFTDKLVDGSGGVATLDPAEGTVTNRVYVEVHNRGVSASGTVQVMLLIADASAGLPPLPASYTTSVQTGTPITSAQWRTVGIVDLPNLRVGVPQVAEFDLPSTMLAPPASLPGHAHFCALAVVHAKDDVFAATETNVDALTVDERKVAQKNLHLVQFVGSPPGKTTPDRWVRVVLAETPGAFRRVALQLDLRGLAGEIGLLAPANLLDPDALARFERGDPDELGRWADAQLRDMARMLELSRFDHARTRQMIEDVKRASAGPFVLLPPGELHSVPLRDQLGEKTRQPLFLRVTAPTEPIDDVRRERFTVAVLGRDSDVPGAGSTYQVEYLPPVPGGSG
ncbi:MAG TPA: hypothetical protein VGH76_27415 [Actinomycetospora sp.]|uniref:WD40/YVTN/BNR-like repeat-containing protein n=1 Tax=Actinomycetospora sp. TaxID=1872135 RepID=UPI002F3ED5B9